MKMKAESKNHIYGGILSMNGNYSTMNYESRISLSPLVYVRACCGEVAIMLMDVWILEQYISSIILSAIGTAADFILMKQPFELRPYFASGEVDSILSGYLRSAHAQKCQCWTHFFRILCMNN